MIRLHRKTRIIIYCSIVLVLLGVIAAGIFLNYIPSGILWKHGIKSSNIKLISEKQWFRFYLYEIEENNQVNYGIVTLHKRNNGRFWTWYNDVRLPANGQKFSIGTHYGGIKDGLALPNYVWGGFLKDNSAREVGLMTDKGDLIKPELTSKGKDGTIYFLHNLGENISKKFEVVGLDEQGRVVEMK